MTTIGLDIHKRESQLCIAHGDRRIEDDTAAVSLSRTSFRFNATVSGMQQLLQALGRRITTDSETKNTIEVLLRNLQAGCR